MFSSHLVSIVVSAPLQLEAIKDTIELFCEEFAAIKSAAMEANQRFFVIPLSDSCLIVFCLEILICNNNAMR